MVTLSTLSTVLPLMQKGAVSVRLTAEIKNHLFGFTHVKMKHILVTPLHEMIYLFPVAAIIFL